MYRPEVLRLKPDQKIENVAEMLKEEGLDIEEDIYTENGEENLTSADYRGRRFEYRIMSKSIVFKDYPDEKVTKDDLKAFEKISEVVEEDLNVPSQ